MYVCVWHDMCVYGHCVLDVCAGCVYVIYMHIKSAKNGLACNGNERVVGAKNDIVAIQQ